jgi:hypothetical protein
MLDVFISHSGQDAAIAEALVELIRAAINVAHESIRCTSVDGYRLPGGASTGEQLKREVREARCLVALLTPESLRSPYVLFELGARWGADLPVVPLLAAGATSGSLKAPLSSLNALNSSSTSQLHQMVAEVAAAIGTHVNAPATYDKHLQRLITIAAETGRRTGAESPDQVHASTQGDEQEEPASFLPKTEAGKELLNLIHNEADAEMRGLVEIRKEIMPGTTHFFPKIQYSGSPLAIKTRHFREGVSELVSLRWVRPPEDNPSTNTRTYEYLGASDSRSS